MPVTTYTPAAADADFEGFTGTPFDDPKVYASASNKRIDSLYFLKPIQDEVLNLIALALSGGTAVLARNTTGSTITKGSLVYISGYDSGTSRFLIAKADATDPAKQPSLVLDADLATASNGKAYPFREVTGLNTNSAGAVGDPAYLDGATAGAFAFSVSANGADTQRIGTVTAKHATTGSIRFYPGRRLVEKIGKLTATGQILATGTLTPSAIGSSQNDYSPTGLSTANTLRLSASAAYNVTGLATGAAGRLLLIHNVGSFAITLKDESASSSAANRFALTADLAVSPDAMVLLQYDGTSSRWRAVGGGGSSSSGGNLANFGNGADGACAFDGNPVTGFTGTAPYVAGRDIYATTVDIDAGQSVDMNGFRLFAKTSMIIDGDLYNNGLDGSLGGGGAPGGTIPGGTAGGAGGSGAGAAGTNATNALGGAGGAGGTGGAGAGGAGGTVTVPTAANGGVEIVRALPYAAMFRNASGTMHSAGTGGGSGSGDGGMTAGGTGGGGGGAVFLASPSITGSGNVNANGGTGANGAGGGNEGGGAGGGGGAIVTIADNDVTATSITFAALGNAGGTGEGTGTNGAAGNNGRVVHIRNS